MTDPTATAPEESKRPRCEFCLAEPDDWCPACQRLLCDDHARYHDGSFDRRCVQGGPMLDDAWVNSMAGLNAEALDRAGVAIGRLGLARAGQVAVFRCIGCRTLFTVTGPPSIDFGLGCLADECSTYDLARDVDIFFEPAFDAGIIVMDGGGDG